MVLSLNSCFVSEVRWAEYMLGAWSLGVHTVPFLVAFPLPQDGFLATLLLWPLGPLAPSRQSRPPSFPQGVWTWGTYPLQHPGQRVDDSTTHSAGNKAEPSPAHPIQVPGASWHQRKLHHPWGYSVLCGLGQWAFGMGRGLAQLSGPRLGTVYGSVR